MSFDDENNESNESTEPKEKKPKTFFGMEMSDGVTYTIIIILTLIFIRQVSVVLQALN